MHRGSTGVTFGYVHRVMWGRDEGMVGTLGAVADGGSTNNPRYIVKLY
jgi:hypothetical protein